MAENPWPLVATSIIADVEARYVRDEVDLLRMHMDMLYISARKELEKAGRMGDVRSLKLYCYDHDITKEKE